MERPQPTLLIRMILLGLVLAALAGCAAPAPTASALRLPTRAPRTPMPTPADPHLYYEAGLAQQAAGEAESALRHFAWAIELAPDFAPAYVARGTVYLARGNLRRALAEADAALEIDPESASAHALRGEALRLQGHPLQASKALDRAVNLDPTLQEETFRSRWLAARAAHSITRLSALGDEYVSRHPDDPLRHYYRGWAYIELQASELAIRVLVRGIEETPDPPALLWFALGQAYATDRSWQQAITALEAARGLVQVGDASLIVHSDQPIATLFGALGQAYIEEGRCVDAQFALEYAIAVGASDGPYRSALEEAQLCQTPEPTPTPYPTTTPSS